MFICLLNCFRNALRKDLQAGLGTEGAWERKAAGNSLIPKKEKICRGGGYCRGN